MRGSRSAMPIGRTSRPVWLVAAALIAGCGSSGSGQSTVTTTVAPTTVTQPVTVTQPATSTEPATTTAPVIPPSTVDGIDPLDDAATTPVTAPATTTDTALLTDAKAARHEGYDRVVFVFRNAVPGYDVRYVERPIVQDGSGDPVDVGGAYVLRVRMDNALDADLSQEHRSTDLHRAEPLHARHAGDRRAGQDRRLRGRADLGDRCQRPSRLPRADAPGSSAPDRRRPQPLTGRGS